MALCRPALQLYVKDWHCTDLYHYYHCRYIKLSSPKLNNVAVIGCILVYGTVVLMGLDDRTMPPNVFSVVCTVSY